MQALLLIALLHGPGDHWAFQPVRPVTIPDAKGRALNPIDRFLLAKLEAKGWDPAPGAPPRVLLRRLTLALTGLPPTLEEQEAILADNRPDAYERLVERLLASPRFGERWGRHWLDVARYADSNGYERDGDKPFAWRFRDWVIAALNADMPYERFVIEQLAGDEVADADTSSVIATGFLRLGPWDDEPADPANDRFDQLDDVLSASAEAFLGMTLGCARCHDHKFEPLTQTDYYRIAAVFAPLTRPQAGRTELHRPAVPLSRRGEWLGMERKLAAMKKPTEEAAALRRKLASVPRAYIMDEAVPPPPTHLLRRGRAGLKGPEMKPGVPRVLAAKQPEFPAPGKHSSLRRLTFAKWVASRDNPLTARVIVNRLWHHHFGRGIVSTPGDLGVRGDRPTHPELLDWLANELVSSGWSLKHVHRLIVTSAAYRMSSRAVRAVRDADPENKLLARFPYRRLEAEAIRDSILAVSGQLDSRMGGPGVRPAIQRAALEGHSDPNTVWKAGSDRETARRSVYIHAKRSLLLPLLESFDLCDTARSAPRRAITTVAPQALMLYNGELVNASARHLAARLEREAGKKAEDQVALAYRLLLAREATAGERKAVSAFIGRRGLAQACRVLLNLNEFVYPD
jgi:hypothetical protein